MSGKVIGFAVIIIGGFIVWKYGIKKVGVA